MPSNPRAAADDHKNRHQAPRQ